MDGENSHMEDSCDIEEYVCGDPKVDIRVGDEYQAEIPSLLPESKRASFLSSLDFDDSSRSFVLGRPLEVMWINTKDQERQGLGDDNVDMNESLKSLKTKRSRRGESDGNNQRLMNLEAVPEKQSSSWDDFEVDGFVLGLYTFGKDFAQMNKLLDSKETGDILSFYYGKFYKSAKHKIWCSLLKKRSRRCVQGKKLYSGWRLQQLLSRLIPSITDESEKKKIVNVSKSFAEGNRSLEDYITAVKKLVGLRSLVEAVAIGKEKEDLTVLTTEPANSKQWFTVSSAVPAAGLGVYTSLTCDEIVEKLSGGSRLSKARCNDIFWEAVWPRLLARGWHSEQPKDRGYVKSKDEIVFLVPGVKKFSRRKLVKKIHYFDCISDILAKVVADPELLEFDTADNRPPVNQEKRRYLRSPEPCSTHMKFTVVDASGLASGGKLCELRELKVPNPNLESCVERLEMSQLDEQKHAKFADECKWEKKRMVRLVDDDPMRFMIVDTSLDRREGGIKRRRHLPGDEKQCKIRREANDDDSPQKKKDEARASAEYPPNGTCSGVKEEALEFVQQGRSSKKRSARRPESSNHHLVTSFPLPKRRRLSACVRNDIKRSGESSVLKPNGIEETGNGIEAEIQERQESEPNGLSSKKQEALHEVCASEEEEEEEEENESKDLETAQQEEKPIQVPTVSGSEKNSPSPSTDHGTTKQEEEEEEQNEQQSNTDLLPRRQSTRKRPLTTRALEALESGFFTAKSTNTTSKPRKRERSTRIKHRNRTQGETENETTASKPLDQIEDSEPSFLVNEATTRPSKPVDQTEDSKKVTTGFPKLPPIVLKLPFKR